MSNIAKIDVDFLKKIHSVRIYIYTDILRTMQLFHFDQKSRKINILSDFVWSQGTLQSEFGNRLAVGCMIRPYVVNVFYSWR